MGNLFTELMRRLFALLDGIVAWAIELLYVLLIKIADTNVFGELIYQYLGRIYTFLGIFMVFKLSFAMINYIINPDTLTDKGKGFSKLITNVVISLILLAITPNLFDAAFKLQSDLLSSNAVYQIVTGKKLPTSDGNSNKSLEENAKVQGKEMSYAVYSSFIYKSGGDDYELEDQKICEIKAGATCLLDEDVIIKKDGKKFTYEYKYLISTICGCAVAYMLLMFCFDAAVRSVKLGFLQIIAPIPILSMIDPGKGTDKVSKWGKECGKTFIDLFVRLAGIFFALDVIHSILSSKEMMKYYSSGASVNNLFVRLFVIIGCLMFAKQLPNLIESILGIKLSGDGFSLKKKLGGAIGGTALVAGGAMAGRALAGVGKIGANTLGAGARLGASSLKNKLTGKDNSTAVDRFRQRMDYSGQEAKARFTSLNKKYSGDTMSSLYKKSSTGEREAAKKFDKGEKLWSQAEKNGQYSIYSNESFRSAAQLMDTAKKRRNDASEAYDIAQTQFQRGEISQEEFSRIRLASIDAQSDFDKAKAAFDEQSAIHTSDAEKYKLYSATADRKKAEAHINSSSSPSPSPSSTPEHGPNGKGDPVPGRPNPNTSQKKQERRNN